MKKLCAALFGLLLASAAQAQSVTMPPPAGTVAILCVYNTSPPTLVTTNVGFVQCDSTGKLIVSGGGGGLSVTDQAAWTQAVSPFAPTGGVFNDTATLSSGQQGAVRLTTKRAMIADIDTTGSALYSALTSATPCFNATAFNTNSYSNAGTNSINCDLNGNLYTHPPANQSTNLAQIAGVATPVGSGVQAAALRTTLATDSPGLITLGQTTKAGSVPVTIASDQYVDPCQSPNVAKSSAAINITTATTTSLVAVSGSTVVYVCGMSFTVSEVITTPNTILFEYGTGAACTSPTALTGKFGDGGVMAGIPIVVSAPGGGTIFKSAASSGICALTAIGATASFQGFITYVQQ